MGSLRHQSIPISAALSTDTIKRRILIVNSSMSSRFTLMSPAMMIPLSSTRSRMSARFAGAGPAEYCSAAVRYGRDVAGARPDPDDSVIVGDPAYVPPHALVALQAAV